MVKLAAGTTTSSGQLAHSRKLSFGLSAHSSAADSGAAPRDDSGTVLTPPQGPAAAGGTTSGPTTGGIGGTISAVCCFFNSSIPIPGQAAYKLSLNRRLNASRAP